MACNECEQYRHQLRALRMEATQAQAILGVIRRAVKAQAQQSLFGPILNRSERA